MGWNEAFEDFPILETDRLRLREIKLADAPVMYSYFSNSEVTQFYDIDTLTSTQEAVELIESLLFRYKIRKQIRWGITWKGQDQLIGTCGFHELEREHLKAEIGYELQPEYWRKGVMTEAVAVIIQYGIRQMGLNRIEALYNPLNSGSKRVLEKNGFIFEGILRQRFIKKEQLVDAAISSIINENLND